MLQRDALREAMVEEMTPRQPRHLLRRGRGRLRRRLQGLEGPARDVRARPRLQHAHLRGRHLRHRRGRGHGRPAPGRRAHVHGLRAHGLGPDRQPGRQVALHERRPDDGAAGHPRLGRRRQGLRRPALAVARVDLHAHARPGGHLPGHGGRCQGPAEVGHPLGRPGALLREPGASTRSAARCPRTPTPRAHRQGPRRPRGRRRHHRGLGSGRLRRPGGGRDAGRRGRRVRRHRPAHARAAGHGDRCWRRCARRVAAWWPRRPCSSAATSTRSWRASWTRPSTTSTRPVARIGAANGISPQAEGARGGLPAQRRATSPPRSEGSSDGRRHPHAHARADDRGVHRPAVVQEGGRHGRPRATRSSRSRPTSRTWRSRPSTRACCCASMPRRGRRCRSRPSWPGSGSPARSCPRPWSRRSVAARGGCGVHAGCTRGISQPLRRTRRRDARRRRGQRRARRAARPLPWRPLRHAVDASERRRAARHQPTGQSRWRRSWASTRAA